jgi:hypothetical protein
MWKKLSIFAIALSLVAPPIVFADTKPGKAQAVHTQPKPKPQEKKPKGSTASTSSNGEHAAPSPPNSGTVGTVPVKGFDLPQNTPTQ